MNYIREINAFYDWLELNELSKSAVLLWHALMHLNNKSGWVTSFKVARSVIEAKTGLKKDAYYIARNLLKQKGLIDFKERGTKATEFQINSLLSFKQTTTPTTNQTTTPTTNQTTTQTVTKLNETKRKEEEIIKGARENIFVYQELEKHLKEKGISQEITNKITLELTRSNTNQFTIRDVDDQYNHMMDKMKFGETIYDFSKYFVGGLIAILDQKKARNSYQEKIHVIDEHKERTDEIYYNWLEEG